MHEKIGRDLPSFEKFRLADCLVSYDRVLYLDADILITPGARDIFSLYQDETTLFALDEGNVYTDQSVKRLCTDFNFKDWPKNERRNYIYFNPVVAAIIYAYGCFDDQNYVNYLIRSQEIPCQSITSNFNCINLIASDYSARFKADFIHYAGAGFIVFSKLSPYEQVLRLRSMQIRRDYSRMYENKLSRVYVFTSIRMVFLYTMMLLVTWYKKIVNKFVK